MRVFVVPTWWPSERTPAVGSFVREQVMALAAMRPAWRFAVSNWGQGELDFALTRPGEWPAGAGRFLRRRAERRPLARNVVEYRARAATWTDRFASGNLRGVVRANGDAFARARAELGGIDVIHAHVSFPGGWAGMDLKRRTGLPLVITEHWSAPPPRFVRRGGRVDERLREPLLAADRRIAVSRAQAETIRSWGVPLPDVVPHAVDETVFVPDGPASVDELVFSTICLMDQEKGVDVLLEGAARLVARLPPAERRRVRFRIGGDGRRQREWRRLGERLGLAEHVQWLGLLSREQVLAELQRAHCFVLASRRESFGVVYVEALACGKPVIATRCGGPEEIVTPETGMLVEPGDPEGLAQALEAFVAEPGAWDANAIRRSFLRRFSRAALADRLEAIYADVTGAERAS